MTCYKHPDTASIAFCRACGRGLCAACQRPFEGTVFCEEHLPVSAYSGTPAPNPPDPNPYLQPPPVVPVSTSPGLAFLLGLIPGVGAIYNGQYLKGFAHVAVLGVLISLASATEGYASSGAPLFALLVAGWYFYMPFEAYHTARRRQLGIPVDEWSSLIPRSASSGRVPAGPMVLIAVGIIFLLNELHILRFREILRLWPVVLIGLGAYSLYSRLSGPAPVPPQIPTPPQSNSTEVMGVPHER